VTFTVICLILFFGVSVFFRVGEIQVEGETRYTAEQVITAAGIDFGTHLFFVDGEAARREIQSSLPYIGHVEIRRRFPNRIVIAVDETAPLALFRFESGYLILDRNAKILERLSEAPMLRLIHLRGLPEPLLPREGEILALGEAGREQLRYLQNILGVIAALGIASEVSLIDMTELHDPEMHYANRFTVRLGPNRNLHHKLGMLVGIVDYMDESETGIIDLNPERPVFRRDEPPGGSGDVSTP